MMVLLLICIIAGDQRVFLVQQTVIVLLTECFATYRTAQLSTGTMRSDISDRLLSAAAA